MLLVISKWHHETKMTSLEDEMQLTINTLVYQSMYFAIKQIWHFLVQDIYECEMVFHGVMIIVIGNRHGDPNLNPS